MTRGHQRRGDRPQREKPAVHGAQTLRRHRQPGSLLPVGWHTRVAQEQEQRLGLSDSARLSAAALKAAAATERGY